jgi:hypothetical protein
LPYFIQFSPFLQYQAGAPYNVTIGNDFNGDTIFNDRPEFGAADGIPAGTAGSNTIAGCGSFVAPAPNTAYTPIPINYCTGPSLFTFNFRLTKTFGFGEMRSQQNSGQGGQGGQRGQGGPGGAGGGGGRGGGGRGGPGGGGPGGGPFGSGSSTGRRYNFALGVQVQNLFNNENPADPIATLSSPKFGQSTNIVGPPFTTQSALRRISLQASFSF